MSVTDGWCNYHQDYCGTASPNEHDHLEPPCTNCHPALAGSHCSQCGRKHPGSVDWDGNDERPDWKPSTFLDDHIIIIPVELP
jgi:hypothetical protein